MSIQDHSFPTLKSALPAYAGFGLQLERELLKSKRVLDVLEDGAEIRQAVKGDARITRIDCDKFYVEHESLVLDLKILLRTPYAVLTGRNAL